MESKQLPKIALGAWAWGNDGTFGGKLTDADLRPVFDAAMKAGLNLWDTAYAYGMGTSEKILGEFLRTVPRDSYLISDKFTPQCADPNAENAVVALYETSAKLLGTDYMDIYWIHNPVGAPEWTRKLIPLAKTGKIGRIGLSNHNLAEIKEAAAILGAEGLKIAAIQNHYSLLNRSSETSGILDYCRENDITFFSYMVLEQGALSGKYDTRHPFPADSDRGAVYNPMLPQLEKLNTGLKEIADRHGVAIAQLPVAWAIAKGTLPIIGVTKVYQVEDAAKAAALELSADEIETMERLASETPLNVIRYWEKEMK
ncbi:MAG TPA: aldo/keto reductase [Candidatus Pullilachnospira gallistercoris]|uniref:Aldo/keto reductase n=1 Tax=Candidatus Pullilachnospira gallistercoris TaxID=2840911 RepID=A0A9D1EBI0_9FIRM|nr:aldo/keto reductase [Candidatus Pullilachnospira gallistercoris]